MDPARLLRIALLGEGLLALVGLAWITLRDLPVGLGPPIAGLTSGAAASLALAILNWWVVRHAPPLPGVRGMRRLYRDLFRPAFAQIGLREVILISAAAGIGEEVFFRGAVQPELGIVTASLLFGAVHVGGTAMIVFGVWAALMGLFLGWLAIATGGLLAPIVAHAAYDALALAYIRWAAPPADLESPGEPTGC